MAAARGVNKVILIGNLGQDPDIRAFPSGGQIANLRIATNESWRDRQTGEQKERTEWHTVVLNGGLAQVAQQYLRKGSQVYIEGRLQTRKWQDKQTGQDRYATEVVALEMRMLGGRGGASGEGGGGFDRGGSPPPRGGGDPYPDYGSGGGGGGGGSSYASASGGSGSHSSSSSSAGGGGFSGGGSPGGGGGGGESSHDFEDDIPF